MKRDQLPQSLVIAGELSLIFNVVILSSVFLNVDWVRNRAAGGVFEQFPWSIRIIYLVMAGFMIILMKILFDIYRGKAAERTLKSAKWIGYLFVLSTFLQLISRSPEERWNALPAALVALCFLRAAEIEA